MARRSLSALGSVTTSAGVITIRKSWAPKQRTFVLTIDGSPEALRILFPERRSTGNRAQVSPPEPVVDLTGIAAFAKTRIASWQAAVNKIASPTPAFATLEQSRNAAERVLRSTVRASSMATYQKQWARIDRYIPADTALVALTRERVQTMIGNLVAAGTTPAGVRNAINALHRALAPAIDAGAVAPRVLRRLVLPRSIARSRPTLTSAQRDALLAAAARRGRDIHLLLALGLFAGLRHGELLALTWSDIDLINSVIRVRSGANFTTKSGRNRVVPIGRTLAAILTAASGPAESFVLKPDHPPRKRGRRWHCASAFQTCVREAGIPAITVHDLRRQFATAAAQAGVSIWKIKGWLGHASVSVTEKYTAELAGFDADVERLG